jgi:serine/threonine-protein kinase
MSTETPLLRFGRYETVGLLASGGMATVYLARAAGALGIGAPVAIKVMHPHLATDASNARRFVDEARMVARIHHPNVVGLLDAVSAGNNLFLVMEYVHGASFSELLSNAKILGEQPTPAIVSSIVHQALLGLHAAHEAKGDGGVRLGLIHRDVSLQNVLVSDAGTVHLTDFGIAHALQRLQVTETTESVLGKVGYMAPEQLSDEPVTQRADLFSMGVVLWTALVGEPLFESQERRIGALRPGWIAPKPSTRNASVSVELDAVVAKMLAREPKLRFATAEAAALALAKACAPASAGEVADWVRTVYGRKLKERTRLLESLQQTKIEGAAASADAESNGPKRPLPKRLGWWVTGAVVAVVGLLLGVMALGSPSREVTIPPASATSNVSVRSPGTGRSTETSTGPEGTLVTSTSTPTSNVSGRSTDTSTGPEGTPVNSTPTSTPLRRKPKLAERCDPPYYFDDAGIKLYYPECVRH